MARQSLPRLAATCEGGLPRGGMDVYKASDRGATCVSEQPQDQAAATGPITLALLLLLVVTVLRGSGPPAAVGERASPDEFSAARAMHDVRAIAVRQHPLGSPENARVRGYLLARLQALGADPEVQTATVARRPRRAPLTFATVHNIIARFAGANSTGTVMLVAHYDSVASGPGAGDDASGVAAILETLRALRSGPLLLNDLLVVFTDGEELGLLGAQGFVDNFARLADIKVVLNFEMRGDEGASSMFQTSAPNEWLVCEFARSAHYPRASSLTDAVYRHMPNDTDLTVFMGAGLAGMNFAALGGLPRYHTALDNPDLLDPGTLQHQGMYALAMARRFGSMHFGPTGGDSAVYFSLGSRVIYYTDRLALPLAILVALLLVLLVYRELRGGRIRAAHVALGITTFAAAIAFALGEAWAFWHVTAWLAGDRLLPSGTTYGAPYFAIAMVALIFATLLAIFALLARVASERALGTGAMVAWALLLLAAAGALPGGSYLLTWPLLFAVVAAGAGAASLYGETSFGKSVCAAIALAPAIVLLAPLIATGAEATLMFLMLAAFGVALLFGLSIPYLSVLSGGRMLVLATALAAIAIALTIKGVSASAFDSRHPRPDSIFYLLDADAQQAEWVSVDPRPDRFTAQFFQHHVRGGTLARIADPLTVAPEQGASTVAQVFSGLNHGRTIEGDAPAVPLAPSALTVVSDSVDANGIRTLTMHIASPRHAPVMWMTVPATTPVLDSSVGGKSSGPGAPGGWFSWYWSLPDQGFDLTLKIKAGGRFAITLIDQTTGLPAAASKGFAPRSDDEMPAPFEFFDSSTLVRKTYVLGGGEIAAH